MHDVRQADRQEGNEAMKRDLLKDARGHARACERDRVIKILEGTPCTGRERELIAGIVQRVRGRKKP